MKRKKIIIGLLHTTIRGDEKLLMDASKVHGVQMEIIDVRKLVLDPLKHSFRFDVVLERCVSTVKGTHAVEFFQSIGIPTVNTLEISRNCENKFLTSLLLVQKKVPTPTFALVFGEQEAKKAILQLGGYPVVIKPVMGSWGRLIARVSDEHALEGIIEQKTTLGGPHHHAIYLQQYIDKPGRDIRIHVIGGRVIAAIYRKSEHWVTNTARGAEAIACSIDSDLAAIAQKAGEAIGKGILGIDIFETNSGYVVNEVNHTMEFKNVQRVTGINIAGTIIEYCEQVAKHDA